MFISMSALAVTLIKTIIVHCNVKRNFFFAFTSWYVFMRKLLTPLFFCVTHRTRITKRKSATHSLVLCQTATLTSFRCASLGRVSIPKANMLWLLALSKFNHHTIYVCLVTLVYFTGDTGTLKYRAIGAKNPKFRAGRKLWDHLVSALSFCRLEIEACDESQGQTVRQVCVRALTRSELPSAPHSAAITQPQY